MVVLDWSDKRNALGPAESRELTDAITAAETKAALRANTEAAIAAGVYGVPTLQIGDALFWGNDAHAFALAALHDPAVLDDPQMQRVSTLPVGISRLP